MDDRDDRFATEITSWKRRTILYRKEVPISREIACFVGLDPPYFSGKIGGRGPVVPASRGPARGALLARDPSAIMRPRTPLATFGLLAGLLIASPAVPPMRWARAAGLDVPRDVAPVSPAADADPDSGGAGGEAAGWLPLPEEDLESLESLEEERFDFRAGALVRGSMVRGKLRTRRIGVTAEHGKTRGELGFLFDDRRVRPGARIAAGGGRALLAAGRVSVSRMPPLLAEAMGLTREGRRVLAPRSGMVSAGPSLGASAGAIDGAVLSRRGSIAFWSFAGIRSGSREALGAVGMGIARGRARVAAGFGMVEGDGEGPAARAPAKYGSITVVRRDPAGSLAVEALGGAARRGLLAEVTARGEAVLFSARWRYLSWKTRKVGGEVSAETRGPEPRVRLSWRSWSANAAADDGLLELEALESAGGSKPIKVRLGAVGLGEGRSSIRPSETYALVDATLARGGGRSLGVHLLKRASAAAGSSASGTTVGARLGIGDGTSGEQSLQIESTRLRRGGDAWGIALSPSGDVTLRSRSKPGIWVAARGGFGTRRTRLGYFLERGEDAAGPRPWSGSVWVGLNSD